MKVLIKSLDIAHMYASKRMFYFPDSNNATVRNIKREVKKGRNTIKNQGFFSHYYKSIVETNKNLLVRLNVFLYMPTILLSDHKDN